MCVDCTIHGCTKWMLYKFFRPELKQLDPFLMLDYFSGTYLMLNLFLHFYYMVNLVAVF